MMAQSRCDRRRVPRWRLTELRSCVGRLTFTDKEVEYLNSQPVMPLGAVCIDGQVDVLAAT